MADNFSLPSKGILSILKKQNISVIYQVGIREIRKQFALLVTWTSDVGKRDLAKHVKDHKEKCMLIWQIKLLSNSKIADTFFS